MAADQKLHHISSPKELDDLLRDTVYVAVDFYADWCPPCKTIAPIFEALAREHAQPRFLAFAKVNVDHVASLAETYRITAMPTFLFFKGGKQVAVNGDAVIRGADPGKLGAAVEKLRALAADRAKEAESS